MKVELTTKQIKHIWVMAYWASDNQVTALMEGFLSLSEEELHLELVVLPEEELENE